MGGGKERGRGGGWEGREGEGGVGWSPPLWNPKYATALLPISIISVAANQWWSFAAGKVTLRRIGLWVTVNAVYPRTGPELSTTPTIRKECGPFTFALLIVNHGAPWNCLQRIAFNLCHRRYSAERGLLRPIISSTGARRTKEEWSATRRRRAGCVTIWWQR